MAGARDEPAGVSTGLLRDREVVRRMRMSQKLHGVEVYDR